jgi:hypothetical protein
MNPDKQRIAIAEVCGWKQCAFVEDWAKTPKGYYFGDEIPDYLTDLNAMHEAEKVLTSEQSCDYVEMLAAVVYLWKKPREMPVATKPFVCATATQRAEAFLRTVGRWEES